VESSKNHSPFLGIWIAEKLIKIYTLIKFQNSFNLKIMKNYALITGASSGIGLAFTEVFAKDGINLMLVARSIDTLKSIQSHLQEKYHIDVHILEKDLSKLSSALEVFDYTSSNHIEVEYLINNA
jgi:short-subunit dehydrogenase